MTCHIVKLLPPVLNAETQAPAKDVEEPRADDSTQDMLLDMFAEAQHAGRHGIIKIFCAGLS